MNASGRGRTRQKKALLLLALGVLAPIFLINLGIRHFGDTQVSLLSPRHLGDKVSALALYAQHRARCAFDEDAPLLPLIARAERRHGLPRGLLRAVVEAESSFRPHRISWTGAMGPAQLMPGTARMLGVRDPFEPAQAVDGSARYLAANLRRFRSVPLAVAAYNAGPGAIRGRIPNNGETEQYVRHVLRQYRRYRPPSVQHTKPVRVVRKGQEKGRSRAKRKASPRAEESAPSSVGRRQSGARESLHPPSHVTK